EIPEGAFALVASAPGYTASDPLVGLVQDASALVLPIQPIPPPPAQVPGVPEETAPLDSPAADSAPAADSVAPADSPPPALTRVVIAAATAQPIAGASVEVLDADGNVVETMATDDTGACSSSDLPAGDFELHASAPGYATSDPQPVSVPDAPVTLQLSPD